jgi:hypothetical protein
MGWSIRAWCRIVEGRFDAMEDDMSDAQNENDDRPTVVGIDPDMNIGDEDPAKAEREEDDAAPDDEDPVDVEDLP